MLLIQTETSLSIFRDYRLALRTMELLRRMTGDAYYLCRLDTPICTWRVARYDASGKDVTFERSGR